MFCMPSNEIIYAMLPTNGYPSDEKVNSPLLEIGLVLVRLDHKIRQR
jgi:hypothetical protein